MKTLFVQRFQELDLQLKRVKDTVVETQNPFNGQPHFQIDPMELLGWTVKAKNLISAICAKDSAHLAAFNEEMKERQIPNYHNTLLRLEAVFRATKEDFEGGYLNSLRNLVQAEVFTSELNQAEELLKSGYATAAAVIAGVVLETTLRDLCTTHSLKTGPLNRMNDDLTKAGAYNSLQQKRILALAAIRNSAAHGKPEEFTAADVRGMIDDVERFLTTTLQ